MNEYQGNGAPSASQGQAYATTSGSLITPELLHSFVVEVKGYLPRIESGVVAYFQQPSAMDRLAEAHGYAHTIKKAALVIGMTPLANIAEKLEGLLEKVAMGGIPLNAQSLHGFQQIVAYLGVYLDHSAIGGALPPTELVEAIYAIENPSAAMPQIIAPPAPVPVVEELVQPPQMYVLSENFEGAAAEASESNQPEPVEYYAEPTINARNSGRLTMPVTEYSEPQPIKADLPPVYVLTSQYTVESPTAEPMMSAPEPQSFYSPASYVANPAIEAQFDEPSAAQSAASEPQWQELNPYYWENIGDVQLEAEAPSIDDAPVLDITAVPTVPPPTTEPFSAFQQAATIEEPSPYVWPHSPATILDSLEVQPPAAWTAYQEMPMPIAYPVIEQPIEQVPVERVIEQTPEALTDYDTLQAQVLRPAESHLEIFRTTAEFPALHLNRAIQEANQAFGYESPLDKLQESAPPPPQPPPFPSNTGWGDEQILGDDYRPFEMLSEPPTRELPSPQMYEALARAEATQEQAPEYVPEYAMEAPVANVGYDELPATEQLVIPAEPTVQEAQPSMTDRLYESWQPHEVAQYIAPQAPAAIAEDPLGEMLEPDISETPVAPSAPITNGLSDWAMRFAQSQTPMPQAYQAQPYNEPFTWSPSVLCQAPYVPVEHQAEPPQTAPGPVHSYAEPMAELPIEPPMEPVMEPVMEQWPIEPAQQTYTPQPFAPLHVESAESFAVESAPMPEYQTVSVQEPEQLSKQMPEQLPEQLIEAESKPQTLTNWEGAERPRTAFDAVTVWGQPLEIDLPETFPSIAPTFETPEVEAPIAAATWGEPAAQPAEPTVWDVPVPPSYNAWAEAPNTIASDIAANDIAHEIVEEAAYESHNETQYENAATPVVAPQEAAPSMDSPFATLLSQLAPHEDARSFEMPQFVPAMNAETNVESSDAFGAEFNAPMPEMTLEMTPEMADDDFFESGSGASDFDTRSERQAASSDWDVPPELLEVFLPEAEEHLAVITTSLPKLAAHPENKNLLQEIRRSAHSLKGSSAVVGFLGITKLAHRMEDLLDLLYDDELKLTADMLDLLFSSTEALENLLNSKSEPEMVGSLYAAYERILSAVPPAAVEAAPPAQFIAPVAVEEPVWQSVQPAQPAQWAEPSTWQPEQHQAELQPIAPQPYQVAALSESIAQQAQIEFNAAPIAASVPEPFSAMADVAQREAEPVTPEPSVPEIVAAVAEQRPEPAVAEAAATEAAARDAKAQQASLISRGNYVRVPIERLDSVVKLVTELIVNRASLEQNMTQFNRQLEELRGNAQRLSRVANRMEVQYEASTLGSGLQSVKAGGGAFVNALPESITGGSARKIMASPVVAQNNYGFDALEFDRYTEFHLLLRELTECSGDMQTMERELRAIREYFESALNRQGRLNNEMQDQLMRLRMVPLASFSSRLHRTAHQVAQQRGRQVNFVIEGEDTRLDKTVIEELADPLLHILRNAIDHGIEPASARQAAGKEAAGTVRLRAYHEGTQTVIQITDDGGGMNPERLRAKAIQNGLYSAADAAKLTEEELFALIFIPGFSTAAEISEISGRGVGMDIVKTTISRLKGRIDLESKIGIGTAFTIRLPMTLAVMRALLVKTSKQTFAIPPIGLQQIVKLTPQMLDRVGDQQVIRINNKIYPLMQLGRMLNLKRQTAPEGSQLALLMKLEDRQFAIAVDETLGGRDVVVKNLGNHIREVRGITGTTLMGDGSPVLILNLPELVRDSLRPASALTGRLNMPQAATQRPRANPPAAQRGQLSVMIVDDSLSVRRVLANRLSNVGWKPIQAKDGLDALEQLQHSTVLPDVVLLDIEMPRMDGYEFLNALRKNLNYANLPVVMITSRAGQKHRDRAFEAGANEFLGKPYQDEELLTLIRKLARSEKDA